MGESRTALNMIYRDQEMSGKRYMQETNAKLYSTMKFEGKKGLSLLTWVFAKV